MEIVNPWRDGPGPDGMWIAPADRERIDRVNTRLPDGDGRRLNYLTSTGRPLVPGAWSGDPWKAPIVLLLLNPAVSPHSPKLYSNPTALAQVEKMARGDWNLDYPNAWLHPVVRPIEPWCSKVVCAGLHRHLTSQGMSDEAAWSRLSQRIAIIELSAWTSYKWSHHAIVGTTPVSISLAQAAMNDPGRIVLLGRGEADWKTAGLVDVDTLPVSLGVRSNQSRITVSNFPKVWNRILEEVGKEKTCK